jgi:DNA-binding NtrC family response regulator
MLATSFVQEFNKKFGKSITGFSPDAVDVMKNYFWKGNVRELKNVIERVVLLETNDVITKESINFLKSGPSAKTTEAAKTIELGEGQHYLKIAKSGVEMGNVLRDLIIQTLKITGGNQIKAAKLLGISRAKLRYRIEQLGINISGKNIS